MKKILVIGDSCIDEHIYCSVERMCPDKPVPIAVPISIVVNEGMAANVHRNILSQFSSCDLLTNENWKEMKKTRYVHDATNYLFLRVDVGGKASPIDMDKIQYDYDLIVVSDYDKGFLSEKNIQIITERHDKVILDTKKILGEWARKAAFIKINNHEYDRSKNFIDKEISKKIIKTCGSKGCEYLGKRYPVEERDVIDVSGAGDTFLAGFCLKFIEDESVENSIIYGNKCASEVVQKRGVTTL